MVKIRRVLDNYDGLFQNTLCLIRGRVSWKGRCQICIYPFETS